MKTPFDMSQLDLSPSFLESSVPPNVATIPLTDRTTAFLRKYGWIKKSSGPAGSLWWRDEKPQTEVAVHANMDEIVGSLLAMSMSLSTVLKVPAEEIVTEISLWDTDVFKFRLQGGGEFDRTIPLISLASLLTSIQRMMRVTSTTALGYRPWVNGNFRKIGDEIYRSMLAGHSEHGSYVIPVFNPVGRPDEIDADQPILTGMEWEDRDVDSLERRVSRGFSRSISAVVDYIIKPGQLPGSAEMHEIQREGVTKELLSYLVDSVTAPSVHSLEVGYAWAQSQALIDLPTRPALIPSEAAEAMTEVASKLRIKIEDPKAFFTGQVTGIQRASADNKLIITIDTTNRGHKTQLQVFLPESEEDTATSWFRNRTIMTIYGKAERRNGSLYIYKPDEYAAGLDVSGVNPEA